MLKVRCPLEWDGQLYDGVALADGVTLSVDADNNVVFDGFPNLVLSAANCTSLSNGDVVPARFLLLTPQ